MKQISQSEVQQVAGGTFVTVDVAVALYNALDSMVPGNPPSDWMEVAGYSQY